MKKIVTATALCLMSFTAAYANQDDGLYAPVAPEGSAFVRFINAGEKAESLNPEINGKEYDEAPYMQASAYVPVKKGDVELMLGGVKKSMTLEEKGFYSAVLHTGTLNVISDNVMQDQAKAQIAFYNLTGKDVALKTADGKVDVVANVSAGKSGYRDINAVPVNLAVFEDAANLAALNSAYVLKRGQQTTVIAAEENGSVKVTALQAKTDTTQ